MIPIPKKYFWETGNTSLPLKIRLWHRTVSALSTALKFAEYCGEVVAEVLGLNTSKYQYVMDGMTAEDWEKANKVNEMRTKEWDDLKARQDLEKSTGLAANQL